MMVFSFSFCDGVRFLLRWRSSVEVSGGLGDEGAVTAGLR